MIFDNVYKKKILYTLLHSMNGGFILSSHTRAVFSHFHIPSLVLIKKKKKNILAMFPSTENNAKMWVESEGKQNTWLKDFFFFFF